MPGCTRWVSVLQLWIIFLAGSERLSLKVHCFYDIASIADLRQDSALIVDYVRYRKLLRIKRKNHLRTHLMAMQSQQDWSFHLECQSLIRWFIVQSDDLIQHVHLGKKKLPQNTGKWSTLSLSSLDSSLLAETVATALPIAHGTLSEASRKRTWHETKSLERPAQLFSKWENDFQSGAKRLPLQPPHCGFPCWQTSSRFISFCSLFFCGFWGPLAALPLCFQSELTVVSNSFLNTVWKWFRAELLKLITTARSFENRKSYFFCIYIYIFLFPAVGTFWCLHIFRPIQVRKCNHDSSPLPLPKLTSYISICPGFLEALKIKSGDLHSKNTARFAGVLWKKNKSMWLGARKKLCAISQKHKKLILLRWLD